jgi:hypothetical protein
MMVAGSLGQRVSNRTIRMGDGLMPHAKVGSSPEINLVLFGWLLVAVVLVFLSLPSAPWR